VAERTRLFFNREVSWLAFNRRVLEEALEPGSRLLERLKFLAIVSSNLDEFFMVRVGGLQQLVEQAVARSDSAGHTPSEQLAEIRRIVQRMTADQYRCLLEDLEPKLAEAGIRRLRMKDLSPQQEAYVERFFDHEVFPVVTPVSLEPPDPLPLLRNLGMAVLVRLKADGASDKDARLAVVAVPKRLARFITLPTEKGYHYVLLEDVIVACLSRLFPGEPVLEGVPFRITRNADLSVREDKAGDLLEEMKEVLTERKESACVRLEIGSAASSAALDYLSSGLDVLPERVHRIPGPIDLSAWFRIANMAGFDHLKLEPWPPLPVPGFQGDESVFDVIARGDVLLVHPYDSFDPVQRLVEEAADDPDVLAIKQVLYRTSENSPIVSALIRAAERDKHVTALVELKARFDEARNIEWARALERAGVQVIYGLRRLKAHAKICVVVRREPSGIRRYVHFGTGNYNEKTARLYSDVGLLTCHEDFAADASTFFNTVTGYSQPVRFRKIESAPVGLKPRLLELIANETERRKQGHEARIVAKANSLVDTDVIRALYDASQAGVEVLLNIRGICCLRPGVHGLSESISVVSIVDRFLEHSRIFCFHNGGETLAFISSADWMPRNLERRVELLVPVEDGVCRDRLIEVLETFFEDNVKARRLMPDGSYVRVESAGRKRVRAQEALYRRAREISNAATPDAARDLEPRRPSGAAV
jgi:polyphosphate kinase